jgi:hypothetical protein
MNALSSYRAVLGLNNAQFGMMQGRQNMLSTMNNAPNFSGGNLLNLDKNFAMNQATDSFEAQAYSVQLDSMEQARKHQFDSFNYFA